MTLQFFDLFALTDCAAKVFGDEHPLRSHPSLSLTRKASGTLRSLSVAALRAIWKEGGPEERMMLAIRVRLWTRPSGYSLSRDWADEAKRFQDRILSRERGRTQPKEIR